MYPSSKDYLKTLRCKITNDYSEYRNCLDECDETYPFNDPALNEYIDVTPYAYTLSMLKRQEHAKLRQGFQRFLTVQCRRLELPDISLDKEVDIETDINRQLFIIIAMNFYMM